MHVLCLGKVMSQQVYQKALTKDLKKMSINHLHTKRSHFLPGNSKNEAEDAKKKDKN